jgi:hypothetical protein
MITSNSVLKIIIVHENLIAGIAAVAVLRRLVAQLEAELEIKSGAWQIDSNVWKFEMLRDPELCVQAAADAAEADMIIISVGGAGLSARVGDWIESVLPMKDGRPAALVALLDRGHDSASEPPRSGAYLRGLAKQHGLDFFCNTDDQSRHIACGIDSIVSRCEGNSRRRRTPSQELLPAGMERQQTQLGKYAD